MILADLAEIDIDFPEADFWLVRCSKDPREVGKPVKQFKKDHIGIRVTRTDMLLPEFLYYAMEFLHMQGLWMSRHVMGRPLNGKPGKAIPCILVEDVQEVELQPTG